MNSSRRRHTRSLVALGALCLLMSGCAAPPTAVSSETTFEPDEGLAVLRLVDVGDVPIRRFVVVSEQTGKEYPMRAVRYGQTSSMTYVGRLPAGRYQPKRLWGNRFNGVGGIDSIDVPLTTLTGKFDVEARRVSELGTMVFMRVDDQVRDEKREGSTRTWKSRFALPLDATPVPVDDLLRARFPELAKASAGTSRLGWVKGTVPAQSPGLLDAARLHAAAVTQPIFVGGTLVTGGPLGVVAKRVPGEGPRIARAETVHAIGAIVVLKDGRWLAGGEEGFLAQSTDAGRTWQAIPGLPHDEVVIHLSQASDGRVIMVTDGDRDVVVYESVPNAIAWKIVRRVPTDREQSWLTQEFGEAAKFMSDFATVTGDRLVIFTRPHNVHVLDLRTGAMESHETPRAFQAGMKVTPDGYLVGMVSPYWIYGSADLGKTWKRLEAWIAMSEPHFIDARRGLMFAADNSMSGLRNFRLRTTEDGGATWQAGPELTERFDGLQRLWTDPSGERYFTVTRLGRVLMSQDQGRTWR